ncbi:diketogulonate reductase-like aldo/keto reductase [Ruminiclostridium sufflavum DSM 19573]|uniref:Diketogulonate reductase-like aldo/keto reductase n=1 Tax=Ruminiclostridium sufflavum DSM 19573 TaxID=1121337 RepID=A0A318XJ15_9FIRM|nr:aldo/keto reductase [Ruminiclostridium sufflavum]PYG85833.1 diketogulonate reductase-like aldo/keto reductase [Ruminiclostridium sufflavum DSM 19573]
MKLLTDCYKLSNGVEIPCIGFGTWQTPDGDTAVSSVLSALKAGFRHIDTAQGYGNEESVGIAVKKSGIDREKIFITSKLDNKEHGYDRTLKAFEKTMKKLDMDYIDLFLIHWPNPIAFRNHWQESNAGTWRAFEELYREGRIRSIGISNFLPHHIEELIKTAVIAPMVNQIRLCPGDTQDEVVDYCRSRDILLEAYSPLGVGRIFEVAEMKALAEKYEKSIAQICIRWSLQRGYLPLPKSVTPERIKENTEVFDFELELADMQLIADLKGCVGFSADPDTITW